MLSPECEGAAGGGAPVDGGALMTVTTRCVHTTGFGLPVATNPLRARMPATAAESATGANRSGRRMGDM